MGRLIADAEGRRQRNKKGAEENSDKGVEVCKGARAEPQAKGLGRRTYGVISRRCHGGAHRRSPVRRRD